MEETIVKLTLTKCKIFYKLEIDPKKFHPAFFLDSLLDLGFRDGDLFELKYVGNKNKDLESWRTK